MLTNKQVKYLHEERNRIMRFTQELREMACEKDGFLFFLFLTAANDLTNGCYQIDKAILEGSAEDD